MCLPYRKRQVLYRIRFAPLIFIVYQTQTQKKFNPKILAQKKRHIGYFKLAIVTGPSVRGDYLGSPGGIGPGGEFLYQTYVKEFQLASF